MRKLQTALAREKEHKASLVQCDLKMKDLQEQNQESWRLEQELRVVKSQLEETIEERDVARKSVTAHTDSTTQELHQLQVIFNRTERKLLDSQGLVKRLEM